jgi:cyanophycinase
MSPSKGTLGVDRGYVIPIGGAEDKIRNPVILRRFADLSGGSDGYVVVIPTASQMEDTGPRYVQLFEELGVGKAVSTPLLERADCERPDYLEKLEKATGIFLTGGNQLRLSTILGGTSVAQLIRHRNADGIPVAGTSAGAAIISEHMIAGGPAGATPKAGGVTLAPGLGLTNSLIVDQHFRKRDRLGRLLTAISYNPFLVGVGIDENTALFIDPDGVFEVVGSGAATVVDPGAMQHSSMGEARRNQPVTLIGLRLHILASGATFDTRTREASAE